MKKHLIKICILGALCWMIIICLLYLMTGCVTEGLEKEHQGPARGGTPLGIDASIDSKVDAKAIAPSLDSQSDLVIIHDVKSEDMSPRANKLPTGKECSNGNSCDSGFCVDGVCCNVSKCEDTCVPSSVSSCPKYSGWTCAPYGSCRAF